MYENKYDYSRTKMILISKFEIWMFCYVYFLNNWTYNAFKFEGFTNAGEENPKRVKQFKTKVGDKIKYDYKSPNKEKFELTKITAKNGCRKKRIKYLIEKKMCNTNITYNHH